MILLLPDSKLFVLVKLLLLWKDTLPMETLIRQTVNWGGLLIVQRDSPLSSWQRARWHAGRHGVGAETPTSYRQQVVD